MIAKILYVYNSLWTDILTLLFHKISKRGWNIWSYFENGSVCVYSPFGKYQYNSDDCLFTHIYVPVLSIVLDNLQQCSFVWYSVKEGLKHSPSLHSKHLNFVLISLCFLEHRRPYSLLFQRPVCSVIYITFDWLDGGAWGLSFSWCCLSLEAHFSFLYWVLDQCRSEILCNNFELEAGKSTFNGDVSWFRNY
jgi:hypothetical protein